MNPAPLPHICMGKQYIATSFKNRQGTVYPKLGTELYLSFLTSHALDTDMALLIPAPKH